MRTFARFSISRRQSEKSCVYDRDRLHVCMYVRVCVCVCVCVCVLRELLEFQYTSTFE